MRDTWVDSYIENAEDFAKPILNHIREVIHSVCPDVKEAKKWSFPNFIYKGSVMCHMAAFKQHCACGFWKASLMQDGEGILNIEDKDGMGHLGKIVTVKDLPKDSVLKKYIKEAMKLNEEGVKLPPRNKASEQEKKELATPDYFVAALKKNAEARKVFEAFSYTNKKEYIMWFEEAKTEATRDKRVAQALEWIAEGKSRNWKYQNC